MGYISTVVTAMLAGPGVFPSLQARQNQQCPFKNWGLGQRYWLCLGDQPCSGGLEGSHRRTVSPSSPLRPPFLSKPVHVVHKTQELIPAPGPSEATPQSQ